MKNFAKTFSAIISAAVIFGTTAMRVAAFDPPAEGTYIGWERCPNGWTYTFVEFDEEPYRNIDGVMYDFDPSNQYCCSGKHNGWADYSGIKNYRYYRDGLPYTGWLKNKSGARKYVLDGYLVKGDFQIGNKIYSFGEDGIYTGKSNGLVLTAECDKKISADSDKITLTVTANDPDDGSYSAGDPYKMECWENGEWEDYQKRVAAFGANEYKYEVSDIAVVLSGREGSCEPNSTKTEFYPLKYYAGERTDIFLPAGYYRIAVPCMDLNDKKKGSYDVYAMFEIIPPTEVKMSEEIYIAEENSDIDIRAYVNVNSEKLAGKDITLKIEKKTELGWETAVEEFKYDENASCDSVSADGTVSIDLSLPPADEYYKTILNIDGNEYETTFRVEVRK